MQKCIACGANTGRVTLSFPAFRHVDFSTIGSELRGSVCGHCQLFQNIDSFAKERLSYQTQFYGSSAQTIHKSARNKKKARTRSEIQADCIAKLLPSSAKACLDIGCFDGALLRALGIVMPAVDKLGYDVNPTHNVVDLAGRLEITSAQEEIFRGRFDAVIYSHSIMYIDNIVNQLKRLRSHLTDEGFVFIQLPDIRINPLYALMGDQAFIFSEDNLERLLKYSGYDSERVYLVGHSNGGFMSYRMACDQSELITGIVSFAGSTWWNENDCAASDSVAVLQIHGTWDTSIRYDGLTPHEGDPFAAPLDIEGCIGESCGPQFDTCLANTACNALWDCYVDCAIKGADETCYNSCWLAAPAAAQLLWMETFACAINAGCYDDPTKSWPGYPGAEEIVSRWAETNGCDNTPEEGDALDLVTENEGLDTYPTVYPGCPEGQSVELWTILYGSHAPQFTKNWAPEIVDWLLTQSKP